MSVFPSFLPIFFPGRFRLEKLGRAPCKNQILCSAFEEAWWSLLFGFESCQILVNKRLQVIIYFWKGKMNCRNIMLLTYVFFYFVEFKELFRYLQSSHFTRVPHRTLFFRYPIWSPIGGFDHSDKSIWNPLSGSHYVNLGAFQSTSRTLHYFVL